MKTELMKQYWRYYGKSFLVSLAVTALLTYFFGLSFLIFFFIGAARDYYHFDVKLFEINRLKAKGLTEEDAANITVLPSSMETKRTQV
jgi:hypothetical protein